MSDVILPKTISTYNIFSLIIEVPKGGWLLPVVIRGSDGVFSLGIIEVRPLLGTPSLGEPP